MNEQQKLTALFGDKHRVLAIVKKATRFLSVNKGQAATYAETMNEFALAFLAIANGNDAPSFKVRHPDMEVNIKADRKCTRYVFGSPNHLVKFALIALEIWTRCSSRPTDFDEAVHLYVDTFDQVATTHSANELWGVDSWLNLARNQGRPMRAEGFQKTMPAVAKYPQFDQHVLEFYRLIQSANFKDAYGMFNQIHKEYGSRLADISQQDLRDYLLAMAAVLDEPEQFIPYIADLEHWAGKQTLMGNLQVSLTTGKAQELVKI